MGNTPKKIKEKPELNPEKREDELSQDELEQVLGGFSLRDLDTTNTTDMNDDTKSKI